MNCSFWVNFSVQSTSGAGLLRAACSASPLDKDVFICASLKIDIASEMLTHTSYYVLSLQLWPIIWNLPRWNYSLVFLGDLEDLLDPLDPIKNIICYTLESTLSYVTFILQRQQHSLIVTSMITSICSFTQETDVMKYKST